MTLSRARAGEPFLGVVISFWLIVGAVPGASAQSNIARLEARYDSLRYLRDQIDVTKARGARENRRGISLGELESGYRDAWDQLGAALAAARPARGDRRALEVIRGAFRRAPNPHLTANGPSQAPYVLDGVEDSPAARAMDSLQRDIYAKYAAAASRIIVDGDTLDRLSILGRLATTDDRAKRERLWRALAPMWAAVNGHGERDSPYALLLELRRRAWGGRPSPMVRLAGEVGLTATTAERWLVQGLEAWRAALPDTTVEPWDSYYFSGRASRRLLPRLPLDTLFAVNDRYYRSLGADPAALNVQYANLPGQVPVAYTTFGATGRRQGGRWIRIEPWVFTAYRIGGLDNLNELLHETGHAVHIAAIRARPAFNDWPDSDLFTEAIADLAMLEIYEPAWQLAFLGDSVPLAESLRAKYAGIVFDMAWALFEYRVHRADAPPPNVVWTEITNRYLRIAPHPELSWWAARGQLINLPGYLSTYSLGAFLVADLRAEMARRIGPVTRGHPEWYRAAARGLFRFGLERQSRQVVEDFLGRQFSSRALLTDLARVRAPERRRRGPELR